MKIWRAVKKLSIADYITLSNGLLGFLAITYILDERYLLSSMLLVVCIGIDGLDGYVARKLDTVHELGSYLDMFSDIISFCFAPALLVYSSYYDITLGRAWGSPINALATLVPMMVVFFGVLRLSRFADVSHVESIYRGLPTPLYTLLIVSITFLVGWGERYVISQYIPLLSIMFVSFLLYSNISYPKLSGLKLKGIGLIFLVVAFLGLYMDHLSIGGGNLFILITLFICIIYIIVGPMLVDRYG